MEKSRITPLHLASVKRILDYCFSKDDKEIFYVTNLEDRHQVWVIPVGGGYPRQVTFFKEGDVKRIGLSPDGKKLALLVDHCGKEEYDLYIQPSEGGEPKKVDLPENSLLNIPEFSWGPDSSNIVTILTKKGETRTSTEVCILDIDSNSHTWLTDDGTLKLEVEWSKDGKRIAYAGTEKPLTFDIYLLDPETKKVRNLTQLIGGENTGPNFSPDGNIIAFTSKAKNYKGIVFLDLETGKTRWMWEEGYDMSFLKWKPSGERFAYSRQKDGKYTIYEAEFPPSTSRRLSTTGHFAVSVRYPHEGEMVAIPLFNAQKPIDLYIRLGKTLRKLTNAFPYGISHEHFIAPEDVYYPSFDGLKIHALYYKPTDVTNYPVLIWIHGGPASQHIEKWDPFIQLFLLNGIAVLAPNIRGSIGYGSKFENMVYHDWGGADLEDVARAVEYIKNNDPNCNGNFAVGGGSYGGYMTMMAVTRYPELWRCGVNYVGIVNLETFYKNSMPWIRKVLEEKYGFKEPSEDPQFYHNRSPINFIDRIRCPVLFMYGKHDPRVPIDEMHQLKKKMEEAGKEFEWEVFEDEGHTMDRTETRLKYYIKMVNFIKKHTIKEMAKVE